MCGFSATLMLIRRPTDGKTLPFRFYFTNFICKEIGIKFLYIFESDFHDFITSENPKTTEQVLVAFVFFDVEIKVFYESKRREKG